MTQDRKIPNPQASLDRIDELRYRFEEADERVQSSETDPYHEITADSREHSLHRHDKRLFGVTALQQSLRRKLLLWVMVSLALLAGAVFLLKKQLPDYNEETPQTMALWFEQQKMLRQMQQVQQWLRSGEAQSDLPPPETLEEVQAWLDQIQLNPDIQKLETEDSTGEPGFVPFQCAAMPVQCPASDIPGKGGDMRLELSYLVRTANTMLVDNGDCEGTVNLIGEYESLFGWRKSEAVTKALTELSVARCFLDQDDRDNAQLHYQKTFCASVSNAYPDQAMSALYGMSKIAWLNQDSATLDNRVQCSESLLDYHLQNEVDVGTLYNYITLSLMHYEFLDDGREAIRLEEKALASARRLITSATEEEREEHLGLMLTLQMNLMEGYLTIGESEPMYRLYEELKSNALLEDGDRLVALGLLVMQDLIDGKNQAARDNLELIIDRYERLVEFNTIWSWSAFDRWQEASRSTRSESIDGMVKELRIALAADRPTDGVQRLYGVRASIGER